MFRQQSTAEREVRQLLQKSRCIYEEKKPVLKLLSCFYVVYPCVPDVTLLVPDRGRYAISEFDIFPEVVFIRHILEVKENFGTGRRLKQSGFNIEVI
jgi:hypothetical protein